MMPRECRHQQQFKGDCDRLITRLPLACATEVKKSTTAATAAGVSAASRIERAARTSAPSWAPGAARRRMVGGGGLDRHHRLPQFLEGDIVQRERAAHARTDAQGFGPRHAQALLAAPAPDQALALQFADRFAHGRAVHPELARQIGFRGKVIAGAKRTADDLPFDGVGDLAIGRMIVQGFEQVRHGEVMRCRRPAPAPPACAGSRRCPRRSRRAWRRATTGRWDSR